MRINGRIDRNLNENTVQWWSIVVTGAREVLSLMVVRDNRMSRNGYKIKVSQYIVNLGHDGAGQRFCGTCEIIN